MTLLALMKKGGLREIATAILATTATEQRTESGTVARVATVAVANPERPEAGVSEEIRRVVVGAPQILTPDDPILAPGEWYPEFHRLHIAVVQKTPELDYGWVRRNRVDLYRQIKAIEDRIDGLEEARLSLIIGIMSEWRELVLKAEIEQREAREPRI